MVWSLVRYRKQKLRETIGLICLDFIQMKIFVFFSHSTPDAIGLGKLVHFQTPGLELG